MKEYTVGSLFAGVGGICLGFKNAFQENARYKLLWANEIDEYACETYRTNFEHELLEGDIKLVLHPESIDIEIKKLREEYATEEKSGKKIELQKKIKDLEKKKEEHYYEPLHEKLLEQPIDILNGGFPCQAFSIAGERKGFDDERGNLFLNIVDLI